MREEPKYQIPEKGKTVWRLYGIIETIIAIIFAGIISFLTFKFNFPPFVYYIATAVVVLVGILTIWLFPNIRWKIWRYEVREQEIEIQSGLFIVKRTLIPMVRVQHVDMGQGPILKKYDLANISISSAATTHIIPMLVTADADALRAKISELAKVAEDDV
ncbi:PH domain-containing protein [Solibacillus sp. CAU 1738]|uniref:PH domain-containing protein n=1 Tax=Solibacillus sp. CAU 1738 TaxID=3140363 RepID=UPI003261498D